MIIRCVWEHNGNDTLLYAENFIGAFTRGSSKEIALNKMCDEVISYLKWCGKSASEILLPEIVQEKQSHLNIADADTEVIFNTEKEPLSKEEYLKQKEIVLKSAEDFLTLYNSLPDKNLSLLKARKTFYGEIPTTANGIYEHTKNVNSYYWGEIGINAGNEGNILDCRKKGFDLLEQAPNYLENKIYNGSCNEEWSLRKVMRRFIWHDRIHAKAMYRSADKAFKKGIIPNNFYFY
ncbi:MAG: hypothetical protein ACI4IQ_02815 [Eubacterium sp.]